MNGVLVDKKTFDDFKSLSPEKQAYVWIAFVTIIKELERKGVEIK